jgi:hypothetical protein
VKPAVAGLVKGLPVICVEMRHMKALLTAQQINKTDLGEFWHGAGWMRARTMKKVLTFAAGGKATTGLALLSVPPFAGTRTLTKLALFGAVAALLAFNYR